MRLPREPGRGQAGLSMVEVMVYISVSGIVLAILTLTLRNMNKGLVQGNRAVKLQQGGREALSIMARDIRNTGLKRALYRDASGAVRDTLVARVANSAADSASFLAAESGRYDQITFRQIRLDGNDRPAGIDSVVYRVDAARQMLVRRENTGPFQDLSPNVDALQFQYGLYALDAPVVAARPPTAAGWTSSGAAGLVFSSTRMAMTLAGPGSGAARQVSGGFDVQQARTYRLEIITSADAAFFQNGGRMSAQILNPAGAPIATVPFIPGLSQTRRRIELTAPTAANCRLAIGLTAAGPVSVRVVSVRFGPVDRGAYTWVNAPTAAERKWVRAVRIMLMAKAGGAGSGVQTGSYAIGNAVVPIRDKQPRRYFEEEVPIVNNGVF